MVFKKFSPYLKGFHLKLAKHLSKRDNEGWKMSDHSWEAHLENKVEQGVYSREQAELLLEAMKDSQ